MNGRQGNESDSGSFHISSSYGRFHYTPTFHPLSHFVFYSFFISLSQFVFLALNVSLSIVCVCVFVFFVSHLFVASLLRHRETYITKALPFQRSDFKLYKFVHTYYIRLCTWISSFFFSFNFNS